jgi:tRNA-dihydrouridine synthase B
MVCAKALCYAQRSKKISAEASASAALARVSVEQMPMAVQIFGSDPEYMAEAAAMIESMSYKGCTSQCAPTAIDINMGCPVRKITSNGEGSALMKDPQLAGRIVRAVADAVSIPVTVKIRAGWDSSSINAPEMAKLLEQSGASLICVHARTKEQLYAPGIDLSVIERTKNAVSVPVVGNGDIYTASDAVEMMRKTGCDGVMIGRGAEGNPWIFTEIIAAMEGRDHIPPSIEERFDTAMAQLDAMIFEKGERVGIAEAKKHMAWYINGIKGAAQARSSIMTASTAREIKDIFVALMSNAEI